MWLILRWILPRNRTTAVFSRSFAWSWLHYCFGSYTRRKYKKIPSPKSRTTTANALCSVFFYYKESCKVSGVPSCANELRSTTANSLFLFHLAAIFWTATYSVLVASLSLISTRICTVSTIHIYTGGFSTLGHNCRRWFPRFLWSKFHINMCPILDGYGVMGVF